jgi:hypothetical protein
MMEAGAHVLRFESRIPTVLTIDLKQSKVLRGDAIWCGNLLLAAGEWFSN